MTADLHYVASARTTKKTPLPTFLLLGDAAIRADRTENTALLLHVQSLLR
jgi:hypothetical protein